ncbi:hypothetical protein [Stratiformator vulcanicus]|uniref:Transmembrane protein (PGPGW) n=1 Tax=Stratiformator vulcanicus TaxID=2527980 RepID=A0A517R0H3_9PLAN|nr:hypothetical protein [Stratiformator vulcanicus]QDT37368.1 hypothetical protein Pan189_17410 [Stratiformator vulcanicus]
MEVWQQITDWMTAHPATVWSVVITSAVLGIGTLVSVPWVIAALPADYFVREATSPWDHWRAGHHGLLLLRILKNLFGILVLCLAVVMLIGPGQGLVALVIGLTLVDFPGKRAAERRLVSIPRVLRTLNWLRSRRGADPLIVDR